MNRKRRRLVLIAYSKLYLQYFLQGLVIIAPVAISIYAIIWFFNTVDDILPNIIHYFFPDVIGNGTNGEFKRIPGVGFLVAIVIVVLLGRISGSFIMTKIIQFLDAILQRTPCVKFIYTSVKDFLEAFAGNKKRFEKPVLVNIDGADVWRIGFITAETAIHFGLENHVVVYVPQSYAIAGHTFMVPPEKIKIIHNISSAEAMKFAVSGGVTSVE